MDKDRKKYLKELLEGKKFGPLTNIPSVDMPWLINYTDEQIEVNYDSKSIYEWVYNDVKNNSNTVAINYKNKEIFYDEFHENVDKFAKIFKYNNLSKGDVISIIMPNLPETVYAFYAANKIGATVNMIHPLLSDNEFIESINQTKSNFIVTNDIMMNKIEGIKKDIDNFKILVVPVLATDNIFVSNIGSFVLEKKNNIKYDDNILNYKKQIKNSSSIDIEKVQWNDSDTAVLFKTGGTTGINKYVELTNNNYNQEAMQVQLSHSLLEYRDKMLIILPMFHGYGAANCIHSSLAIGISIILDPKPSMKEIDKLILKHKPQHILGVPAVIDAIVTNKKFNEMLDKDELDLSFVKNFIAGGDRVSEEKEKEYIEFFKNANYKNEFLKGYGMTESVAGVVKSINGVNDICSIGIPLINTNIKIWDNVNNEELDYNKKGEICISGPTVMKSYLNNEDETNKMLRLHSDNEIWLHSGDEGYMSEDGQIFYQTRNKKMIITNGYNIYPNEIEDALEKLDFVKEVVVVGISDDVKGQVPIAYIVKNDNNKIDENILISEIVYCCNKNVAKYSKLEDIIFIDELPRTKMKKVDFIYLINNYENYAKGKEEKNKVKKMR